MSTPNGPGKAKHAFDMENDFQAEVPVEWTIVPMQAPGGQRLALCFRIPNTTVTLVLQKAAGEDLRDNLTRALAGMSGLIVPPGN